MSSIFHLINPPTADDTKTARQVLNTYTFPWEWTIRRNARETGQATIPVGFKDKNGSLGFYTQTLNRIDVDPVATFTSPARFQQTLAHEAGHLIDDTVLFHDTRRQIHALMHRDSPVPLGECPSGAYWRSGVPHRDRPTEAFANLAPHIWCPPYAKPSDRYGPHHFTRLDDIKELVMADAVKNPPFDDIAGHTHEQAILRLARAGIAFGKDGHYFPDEHLTRAQMASFLDRALDLGETA